jgi:hypothetical protein
MTRRLCRHGNERSGDHSNFSDNFSDLVQRPLSIHARARAWARGLTGFNRILTIGFRARSCLRARMRDTVEAFHRSGDRHDP